MQHDEAEPVARELDVRGGDEPHGEPGRIGADLDGRRDVGAEPAHREPNVAAVGAHVDGLDHGGHGVPVAIAHDGAHAARDGRAVERDVGELVAAELEVPWPDVDGDRLGLVVAPRRLADGPPLGAHRLDIPPSTANAAPVANELSSLAR